MTYPWVSGDVLNAADLNTLGLVRISQTTLSGVTNSISNVFSSTYDNYRIVAHGLTNASGTTRAVDIRFRTSSDDTSANYFWSMYGYYGATPFNSGAGGDTSAELLSLSGTNGGGFSIDVHGPNVATATTYGGQSITYQGNVSSYVTRMIGGGIGTATQYTGFSIIGVTDNLGGTVTVYGYTNP